eukprot:1646037-Rhodomonas_salina.1
MQVGADEGRGGRTAGAHQHAPAGARRALCGAGQQPLDADPLEACAAARDRTAALEPGGGDGGRGARARLRPRLQRRRLPHAQPDHPLVRPRPHAPEAEREPGGAVLCAWLLHLRGRPPPI